MTEKHSAYFNLLDALKEAHCPICFLSRKSTTRFLDNLLYENVNDPGVRMEIRESMGFCKLHSWQLVEFGDGLGISIIHADILRFLRDDLTNNGMTDVPMERKVDCLVCKIWRESEEMYVDVFVRNYHESEMINSYKNSFGFCFPHFTSVYRSVKTHDAKGELLKMEVQKINFLISELEEYNRKHDYKRSNEAYGNEKDSWIRVVEFLKGRKDLLRERK